MAACQLFKKPMKKKCSRCKKHGVPLMVHNRQTDKTYYWCRPCNSKRMKKYRATEKGKIKFYKAVYKSIRKNKGKQLARLSLNYQVSIGNVAKPDRCSKCRKKKKLQGHHEDYSKPLKVKWLCIGCHADEHRKIKKHEKKAKG